MYNCILFRQEYSPYYYEENQPNYIQRLSFFSGHKNKYNIHTW